MRNGHPGRMTVLALLAAERRESEPDRESEGWYFNELFPGLCGGTFAHGRWLRRSGVLATDLGCKVVHVPGNLLVGDPRVYLGGLDVGMPQHLGYGFDGHSVLQGNCGSKSVPGTVPSDVLVDIADGDDLLDVVVHLLVGEHREHVSVLAPAIVLLDEHQGNIQQRHVHIRLCFLAVGDNPLLAVLLLHDLLVGELLHVDVGEACVAAEDEHVPDGLKALGGKLLIIYSFELFFGEVAAIHRVEVQLELGKGIACNPSVVPAHLEDGCQLLHHLHCGVVGVVVL